MTIAEPRPVPQRLLRELERYIPHYFSTQREQILFEYLRDIERETVEQAQVTLPNRLLMLENEVTHLSGELSNLRGEIDKLKDYRKNQRRTFDTLRHRIASIQDHLGIVRVPAAPGRKPKRDTETA